MFRRNWKNEMTVSEVRWGMAFFALYLTVFPWLNALFQHMAANHGEGEGPVAEANVLYYAALFLMLLLIFRKSLKRDLAELMGWLPESLYGILLGLAVGGGLRLLLQRLPFPVADLIPLQYAQEYQMAPAPTLALILLLIPLVEEIVFRGLLYGRLREYSRAGALVLVSVFCAIFAVWHYAWSLGDPRYLLLSVLYLPMAVVLTLCYESVGSVWPCVVLHGGLNALTLLSAL